MVRLKGGDPFVFGRGAEECRVLFAAGIRFGVVPGVTAATAVAAYAGIPLTHRGLAASYAVISATLAGGAPADLARTAAAADTLVLLMAAERLSEVCTQLIAAGRPAGEPAAVVASASTGAQRVVTGTLAELAASEVEVDPPATLVTGPSVALAGSPALFAPGENQRAAWPRGQPGDHLVLVDLTGELEAELAVEARRAGLARHPAGQQLGRARPGPEWSQSSSTAARP